MAQSTPVLDKTFLAQADLTTNQFRFVRGVADYTVGAFTTLGQRAMGVQQNLPGRAGAGCVVRMLGTSKVVVGAALSAWAEVTGSATGKAVAAASGHAVNGILCQASTADGDIVECVVLPGSGRAVP